MQDMFRSVLFYVCWQVNGVDLATVTHYEAVRHLGETSADGLCQLAVYRESPCILPSNEQGPPAEQGDIGETDATGVARVTPAESDRSGHSAQSAHSRQSGHSRQSAQSPQSARSGHSAQSTSSKRGQANADRDATQAKHEIHEIVIYKRPGIQLGIQLGHRKYPFSSSSTHTGYKLSADIPIFLLF